MLKLRLRRVGSKRQPSYRIVVAESTAPRDGKFIEVVGFYNPRTQPETITVKEDRALYWLSVGAQPTDSLARLFNKCGTMGRFARMKAGEELAALVAEAQAAAAAQHISPQTRVARPEKKAAAPEDTPVDKVAVDAAA
ncbi:MAG: 30S ribosomal protein S16 [Anaerolineae bacterium]|nr:30S ribosomal protein S16 [Anaerolineae bacterium]